GIKATQAAALQFKGGTVAVINIPDENKIINLTIRVIQRIRHASLPERECFCSFFDGLFVPFCFLFLFPVEISLV
ncbi:MAG: hypothetical protein KAS17_04705, partial [Victivallaceae bacterium]|nr:hypothetical protein [Victivallaceae bacterium]